MASLPVLDKECNEAFDRAAETGGINPLRFFLIKWATHVAIHRWPSAVRGAPGGGTRRR